MQCKGIHNICNDDLQYNLSGRSKGGREGEEREGEKEGEGKEGEVETKGRGRGRKRGKEGKCERGKG